MEKKVEVSVDFVKQAYAAACNGWKVKIEKEFPELFQITYKAGSRIRIKEDEYILVNIGESAFLFRTDTGNVWSSTPMKLYVGYVTIEQLDTYIGCDWATISRA